MKRAPGFIFILSCCIIMASVGACVGWMVGVFKTCQLMDVIYARPNMQTINHDFLQVTNDNVVLSVTEKSSFPEVVTVYKTSGVVRYLPVDSQLDMVISGVNNENVSIGRQLGHGRDIQGTVEKYRGSAGDIGEGSAGLDYRSEMGHTVPGLQSRNATKWLRVGEVAQQAAYDAASDYIRTQLRQGRD
jgi:hypothetical protein